VKRLLGRKRVLVGVMIVMCVSTVLCIVSMALGMMVVGRILQGGSVIKFGIAFLIMREYLSSPAFGMTGHRSRASHVDSLAPVHLSSER
jgi:MFS family permease